MKYEIDVNRGEFFATDTTTNLVYKHEVELNVYDANESDVSYHCGKCEDYEVDEFKQELLDYGTS